MTPSSGKWGLLFTSLGLLLASCAITPSDPARAACLRQMETLAQGLMPAFASLGYQPSVRIQLDDALANGRGFAASPNVLGDSMPGGRVRLRSILCQQTDYAYIVVAHEMSHVALNHIGQPSIGVSLAWETPHNELEADALAGKVLKAAGARQELVDYLACRLGQCSSQIPGLKHKPVGSGNEAAKN
ncbi:MAG TPA: hypothetical protein VGK09_04590 [Rhodocyclaceae bacterium]